MATEERGVSFHHSCGSWGVNHAPVDGPTPRYIPGALIRISGFKKRHEVGKGVQGQVLGQLVEGTVYRHTYVYK